MLGAYKSKNYTAIDSASTLLSSLESGKFYFKGSTIHPSDEPTSGACIIYTEYTIEGSPANFGAQYAYCLSDGAYYVRYWWGSAWMDWQRLDNFGCNTLPDLASALGGEMVYKNVEYYSTKETIELGGYGLYILTDCANTGGTTLFTYTYQANSVNIISDPAGNVSSGHYSITKSSTGTTCVVTNNNTTKATTIIKIGGSR